MIAPADLHLLTQSRWHVPLLACMSGQSGGRFAALAAQLGISRSALSSALAGLQGAGWVTRNSGHGHPLRPEYLLTDAGRILAGWCERVMEQRQLLGLERGSLSRWSLPVVASLNAEWRRFSTLQEELKPVTSRALSLTLKQMLASDLVKRRVEEDFPPRPLYGLASRGMALAAAMAA